jgi:DNA-binding NarL/FixJ family response regulator
LRVVLATDRPHLGDALRVFLSEHGIDVVAIAADAGRVTALVSTTHPDVVLIDWQLTGAGASCVVADLKRAGRPAPVIVMRTSTERPLADMAEADGHVTVGDPPEELLAVLRQVVPMAN